MRIRRQRGRERERLVFELHAECQLWKFNIVFLNAECRLPTRALTARLRAGLFGIGAKLTGSGCVLLTT
jgi:hypothetical protein